MLGRIIYERGRGPVRVEGECFGPLEVAAATVCDPAEPGSVRGVRRIRRAERLLRRRGVGRIILPEQFPYRDAVRMLRPVEVLPLYRAHADLLVRQTLAAMGVEERRAVVVLQGGRMSPELYRTACALCPLVRGLCIRVPGEGAWWEQSLLARYGMPGLPPGMACLTAAFSPGEGVGRVLPLFRPTLEGLGLRLWAEGLDLPEGYRDGLLTALWERGCLDRRTVRADLTLPLDKWGESTYNSIE